jgi:hypothetical protein
MWFNFWWARLGYLRQLVQPIVSNGDRWYYEMWLGMREEEGAPVHQPGLGSRAAEAADGGGGRQTWRASVWSNCSDCWSLAAPEPLGTCWDEHEVLKVFR